MDDLESRLEALETEAKALFSQHQTVALHFSGGKDSLACPHLLRPYWDKITVTWGNSGAAFPETIAQMAAVRALVPHLLEVSANVLAQNTLMGLSADVVPIRQTALGRSVQPEGSTGQLVQSHLDCCIANIVLPIHQAMANLEATLVIRGQRRSESRRAPIRSGHQENGVTYWFPIETWTDDQVFDYLRKQAVEIPKHYQYTKVSLDC